MSFIAIKIKRLDPKATLPLMGSVQSAGFDLTSLERCVLEPTQRAALSTGLALEIPEGFEGQIRPRSGLALHEGLTVLNSPGTIDADFRGEIKVVCINLGHKSFTIEPGMRIAQLVISPVLRALFEEVDTLETTSRGHGGFGSSGY